MNKYVADKMAIVLYLEKRKLPNNIKTIFNDTLQGKAIIYFSTVSLMEIGYLSEKRRIDITIYSVIQLTKDYKNFNIHSLDSDTVIEAFTVKNIPKLHDRLITASARILKAALITNDPIIINSEYVKTVWQTEN